MAHTEVVLNAREPDTLSWASWLVRDSIVWGGGGLWIGGLWFGDRFGDPEFFTLQRLWVRFGVVRQKKTYWEFWVWGWVRQVVTLGFEFRWC